MFPKHRTARTAALSALLALSLLLSACGRGGRTDETTSVPTDSGTTGTSAETEPDRTTEPGESESSSSSEAPAIDDSFPGRYPDASVESPVYPESSTELSADQIADGVTLGSYSLEFDAQGQLRRFGSASRELELEGILVDVGYGGEFALEQSGWSTMEHLSTWDLPVLAVKNNPLPEAVGFRQARLDGNTLYIEQSYGPLLWVIRYTAHENGLEVSADIYSFHAETVMVSGVNFIARGLEIPQQEAWFEYPGSLPYGRFRFSDLGAFTIIQSQYSTPQVHVKNGEESWNVLFVNPEEKWRTAAYLDWDKKLHVQNLAAVEAYMEPGEALSVGSLYLQLPEEANGYRSAQMLYTEKGWTAPEDGLPTGPIYEGHPAGTMDSGYKAGLTLQEYADYLPTIKAMGYDYVWLQPIFTHPIDLVYSPPTQEEIDPRYGGAEGAAYYIEKAHELGLGVLFDLVPHGPEPHEPLVGENPDWPSKKADGSLQIEWECVSFDYNNPDYMAYTHDLIHRYAAEMGLDGARIDCAMGGLSNWEPQPGFRPSQSGLRAGQTISRVVREAIQEAGRKPLILPENFHPVPSYAPYTDLFYDMTLYRVIFELRMQGVDEAAFASEISHWLSAQHQAKPEGLTYLRFLGNHDTSDWTWDAMRPTAAHGLEKARALWAMMHFIDGEPLLYAGDENSELYGRSGINLENFFAEMNRVRAEYFHNGMDTVYLENSQGVINFLRQDEDAAYQVLVSLSSQTQTVELLDGSGDYVYGKDSAAAGGTVTLEPYGWAILRR